MDTQSVQLPRTPTRRGAIATLTLIRRVNLDPNVPGLLAFEGRHYKPGSSICEPDLSTTPLVLETTEAEDSDHRGPRRRWALLLVLWRYDRSKSIWVEIAKVQEPCSYEAMGLRQLAARALQQDIWREMESLDDSALRIRSYLQSELHQLGERQTPVLELVLHDLIGRLVAERGSIEYPVSTDSREYQTRFT